MFFIKLLDEEIIGLSKGDKLSGKVAFKLYDTYGFPVDLTADALRSKGIAVDQEGFEAAMAEQRARARAASRGTGDEKLSAVWFDLRDKLGATEFLGYTSTQAEAVISAIIVDGKEVDTLTKGRKGTVLLNQTPFYGESGGQVGDSGEFVTADGKAHVSDTQKLFDGALYQHFVSVTEGELKVGEPVVAKVNADRRHRIKANHSATHLLHAALRDVLGDHVFQKGSLVTPERLRFDFSHGQALTADQFKEIEAQVNNIIWQNLPVSAQLMDKDAAIDAGALALFGEKYADEVRVLTMGENTPYSVELCGGTHVSRTGDIGLLRIVSESSVASGVRRVEAAAGPAAFDYLTAAEDKLKAAAASIKASPEELPVRIEALQAEKKKLEKELKQARLGGGGNTDKAADLLEGAQAIGKFRYIGAEVEGLEPADLREMVDDLKNRIGSGIILLGLRGEGKATLVAGVTADLTKEYHAGKLVNAAAEAVGGRGGGRPDMAMAGGKNPDNMPQALEAARKLLA